MISIQSIILSLGIFSQIGWSHMSMQFPLPRDKLNGADYLKWQQNEPMYSVHPTTCHSLDADDSIRPDNVFAAGDEVVIDLYGTASHNGGHCAFWYSTDGDVFTKIIDIVDCTIASETKVRMVDTMPTACATRCIFAFTWTPTSSGLCEIYMNCADIQVSGTSGGEVDPIEWRPQEVIDSDGCVRVDEGTHYTTHFGELKTSYSANDGDANGNEEEIDDSQAEENEEVSDGDRCYGDGARDLDGSMNLDDGTCDEDGIRCDDGMCCSAYGYCGPELAYYEADGTPVYCDYSVNPGCVDYYDSEEEAYAEYCTDNTGDWRITEENCDAFRDSSYRETLLGGSFIVSVLAMSGFILSFM